MERSGTCQGTADRSVVCSGFWPPLYNTAFLYECQALVYKLVFDIESNSIHNKSLAYKLVVYDK